MNQQALTHLINATLNESATDADREQLEARLRGNPDAIRLYLEYCEMHVDLSVDAGADKAMRLFCDRQAQSEDLRKQGREETFLLDRVSANVSRFSRATVCGMLACSLAFVLGGLWWTSRHQQALNEVAVKQTSEATSTSSVKAVTLTSGSSTTLHLDKVGQITLHGPAKFRLLNPMRARLDEGRIRMRVTEKSGRGFVVETPDGDITDLGTEFGVDVGKGRSSVLAVFEGMVDLEVAEQPDSIRRIERLVGGDGIRFNRGGKIDRLRSIRKDELGTFTCADDSSAVDDLPLIADVFDNLTTINTRRFYEIVPKGMREDASAFVDRLEHEWNGLSREAGMPRYLIGADYIKTFNDDKRRGSSDFQMTVVLNRPATLFVLFDKRLVPPQWLTADYERTYDLVGLDTGRWNSAEPASDPGRLRGVGSGQSIDHEFSIWMRHVDKAGSVTLGRNGINFHKRTPYRASMYGVVAVEAPGTSKAKRDLKSMLRNPSAKSI